MTSAQIQAMPQEKFLLVAVNLLHTAFVEAARTEAKKLYNEISQGSIVHLTSVKLADDSIARFDLSLAHGEYQGSLNYGAFRASLTTLIGNISKALSEEKELRVFNALNGGNAMIFGITAVTHEDDKPNVMVLAADTAQDGGGTTLQLMYLNPEQFMGAKTNAGADEQD